MATSRQIEFAAAPARPPVDTGGPLGKRAEAMFADVQETVVCANASCRRTNLVKMALCTKCGDVLPAAESEQDRRYAARCVRRWARRKRQTKKAARPLARELRFELGLANDPQAVPSKAPRGCAA